MECYDLQCFCCTTLRDMAICEEVPSQRSYQRLVYYNMQWYAGSPQINNVVPCRERRPSTMGHMDVQGYTHVEERVTHKTDRCTRTEHPSWSISRLVISLFLKKSWQKVCKKKHLWRKLCYTWKEQHSGKFLALLENGKWRENMKRKTESVKRIGNMK
jgi:hypothetical protein